MAETEVQQAAETEEVSIGVVSTKEFKEARAKGEMTVTRPVETETESEEAESGGDAKSKDGEKHKRKGGGLQRKLDSVIKEKALLAERLAKYEAKEQAKPVEAEAKNATEETEETKKGAAEVTKPESFPEYEDWTVQELAAGRPNGVGAFMDAREAWKEFERQKSEFLADREKLKGAYNTRVKAAESEYPDWKEVVGQNIELPPAVGDAIVFEMENGEHVAYFLGKNPDICKELLNMGSKALARIWEISDEIAEKRSAKHEEESDKEVEEDAEGVEVKAEEKPKSKAAPPIKPVGGSNTKSSVPMGQMDMKSFKAARDAGRVR